MLFFLPLAFVTLEEVEICSVVLDSKDVMAVFDSVTLPLPAVEFIVETGVDSVTGESVVELGLFGLKLESSMDGSKVV